MNLANHPKYLPDGGWIRLISPAGPIDANYLHAGVRWLRDAGYNVDYTEHVLESHGYLSAPLDVRLTELEEAFFSEKYDIVWATRGGFGCVHLLSEINFEDLGKLCKLPLLVGFSDLTALQIALWTQLGKPSLHGPMIATSVFEYNLPKDKQVWFGLLAGNILECFSSWRITPVNEAACKLNKYRKTIGGTLLGGNLTVLMSLAGTRFFPNLQNTILILEDVNEPAYRIDRLLSQLRLLVGNKPNGIILGEFVNCQQKLADVSVDVNDVISESFNSWECPIFSGAPIGHYHGQSGFLQGLDVKLSNTSDGWKIIV
jgi:muramoyltetrapeptide carboxypeptidase